MGLQALPLWHQGVLPKRCEPLAHGVPALPFPECAEAVFHDLGLPKARKAPQGQGVQVGKCSLGGVLLQVATEGQDHILQEP
eukprot:692632-Alexandrium_andersonii.AAC.1